MSLPARVASFVVCGVAGYFAASAFSPPAAVDTTSNIHGSAASNGPASLKPLTGNPAESAMVAEWEQLRREHGGATTDFAALYSAVKDHKDAFRRRAFRSAAIAEWAAQDPRAALAYILEKDSGNAGNFIREWLRLDPENAITSILAGGGKALENLRSLQGEIAQLAPARLAEVAKLLPKSSSRWDTTTQDAFATFAKKEPEAARVAAESITGPLRAQALAGVAKSWAERDGAAALDWARAMPEGEVRDAALKAALVGWAKTDPVAALDKIDLAPPGGDEMYYASDTGAQVLREAAGKDWNATMKWLADNPGKLGSSSLNGLQGALSQRLLKDPSSTLREIADRGISGMTHVFANSILNEGYLARDAIWTWLDGQPKNSLTSGIRSSLINAIAWKEPELAIDFLEKLPDDGGSSESILRQGAQAISNGGQRIKELDSAIEKASPKLRQYLIEAGFNFGSEIVADDPQRWLGRLNELPEDRKNMAMSGFARGWASGDPEAALKWAMSLKESNQQMTAVSAVASAWAQADPISAASWIDTLPAGPTRDRSAQSLVHVLAQQQPEAAWTWALSIEGSGERLGALQTAYQSIRRKDPAIANEMLQSAELTPDEMKTLKALPEPPPGVRFMRY